VSDAIQMAWGDYSRWFGDAMALMMQRCDKGEILAALALAHQALDDVLAALAPEGTNKEADIARRAALGMHAQVEAIEQEVSATKQ
jgi:hypothetical protein